MRKIKALLILAIFVFCLMGFASSNFFSHTNDKDFSGISEALTDKKNIHLVVIHGIGSHCIGYSQELLRGILTNMGITFKSHKIECILPGSKNAEDDDDYNKYQLDTTTTQQTAICNKLLGCEIILLTQFLKQKEVDTLKGCKNYNSDDDNLYQLGMDKDKNDKETRCIIETKVGYVWTAEHNIPDLNRVVRSYEITWDPATRWAKTDYIDKTDIHFRENRNIFNGSLKSNLVNQSIADAVLYLGDYKLVMQYPLIVGLCKVLSYGSKSGEIVIPANKSHGKSFKNTFKCYPDIIAATEQTFDASNSVSIITHSLGTRMLFDVLGMLGSNENIFGTIVDGLHIPTDVVYKKMIESEITTKLKVASDRLKKSFLKSIDSLYLFANQVPLLELSQISSPLDSIKSRYYVDKKVKADLGVSFNKFIENRPKSKELFQIVSFTDNDDLLSYNLKCWYYLNKIRYQAKLKPGNDLNSWRTATKKEKKETLYNLREDPFYSCSAKKSELAWEKASPNLSFSDVTVNLPKATLSFLVSNPITAHSGYFQEDKIHKLIACGGLKGDGFKTCKRQQATKQ